MAGAGTLSGSGCLLEFKGDSGMKMAAGTHVNIAASDTVVTGLASVTAAFAVPKSDPAATASVAFCSCDVGDQAGTPAAGSFLLKSWEADGTAATNFGESVQWIALGK